MKAILLAASLLLAASVALVPSASAGPCLEAGKMGVTASCAVCNATSTTELACTAEAGANGVVMTAYGQAGAIAGCIVAGLPNVLVTCLL